MDTRYLLNVFESESRLLDAILREHPRLRPLFSCTASLSDTASLREAYLGLLKLSADYVQFTVPALRAAGHELRNGDDEDRQWSALLLDYATGESDEDGGHGHHVWARNDMAALDASRELLDAPPHPAAVLYGNYFIDDVARHPYAILGAKGVLEHLSIRSASDLARGLIGSGIPNASNAISFIHQHGVLDVDHVRDGDHNLCYRGPGGEHKLRQVLEGAYFTSGAYRALVHHALPK